MFPLYTVLFLYIRTVFSVYYNVPFLYSKQIFKY